MGGSRPKQFVEVLGKPVLAYTTEIFQKNSEIDFIEIVCHQEWMDYCRDMIQKYGLNKVRWIVPGGDTFQDSVMNGIDYLKKEIPYHEISFDDNILIQYGAAPFTSQEIVNKIVKMTEKQGTAVAAIPCFQLMGIKDSETESKQWLDRDKCIQIACPQGFKFGYLADIYERACELGLIDKSEPHTTSLMYALGDTVHFVYDDQTNIKITTKDDMELFEGYVLKKRRYRFEKDDDKKTEEILEESLECLEQKGKLKKPLVLWGIGSRTELVIDWISKHYGKEKICAIADNFKYTFYKEYQGIRVIRPCELSGMGDFVVLLAVNYAESIRKQLQAYGVTEIYNLYHLSEDPAAEMREMAYHYTDRSQGKNILCYILAGYEPGLWDNTLQRIKLFSDTNVDYCIVSSGKYDTTLDEIAEKCNWSYLYTEKNQVCYIQNKVIELHPDANYIIKLDEDIFIGKDFFRRMVQEFYEIEKNGDYRVGFAVPVIPLNCCGYVSYLNLIGKKKEYEERFGRAYKSRFSAIFNIADTAEFLWDTMDTFDNMAEGFLKNKGYNILDCYYNIGCIMFTRERWLMMGKWPEKAGESGMGRDEAYIYQDNAEKDLSIYEIQSVLAGHLAFGHQKKRMLNYYQEHKEKFMVRDRIG